MIKYVYRSPCKVPFIRVRFEWKFEFSQQIFEKSKNSEFHENPSSGSRVVPYGRKDMTKLIVAIRLLQTSGQMHTVLMIPQLNEGVFMSSCNFYCFAL
jgi:hypothetical protein